MDTQQALSVIKQIIDQSIGCGLFKSADNVIVATNALHVLEKALQQPDAGTEFNHKPPVLEAIN
jgi:hypothetical protein